MAIYEYACIQCDKQIEVERSMSDPEILPPCPACGYDMARVYNAPGIKFNGSGFYKTDNR